MRPQEPKEPLLYATREVKFQNRAAGITLAGTLSLPNSDGPYVTVILIWGSGKLDRDAGGCGHKPFLVWADVLTRNGLAILRFDKRGVGESGGCFSGSTSSDFTSDVESAYLFLREQPEIKSDAIGLIGHSEGGMIAPRVCVKQPSVAFLVAIGAPILTGVELAALQSRVLPAAEGLGDEAINDYVKLQQRLQDALLDEEDDLRVAEIFRAEVRVWEEVLKKHPKDLPKWFVMGPNPEKCIPRIRWSRELLRDDPGRMIARVRCPTLMLYGEKDMQVPARENISRLKRIVKSNSINNISIKELPGLNHLLQNCQSGAISRYEKIKETVSSEALEFMCSWISGLQLGE